MTRCDQPDAPEAKGWQVMEVSSAVLGVQPGMTLSFRKDSLVFSRGRDSVTFGYLGSKDRVILENREGKHLFSRMMNDDSLLVWRELYTDDPLVIRMMKNKNR
ncbi:MAG TPA: hypothetical protein P5086_00385 [Prolixibacteraceae bacterium]|jgi:hypothetical protein|nr:hypothetical protein [Prolixibacteraceae bacterium]HOY50705.1 hypothetical protein [Prolixibacteraceae bacterium]HPJ78706.1 hypothetical protein [Prolixibacteraceae bacterium]HRV87742.1 hypothetical protein [Prolixibacteraceae bacterium]